MSQEEEDAAKNPMIVMIDETVGHRYMRAVGKKGLGDGHEMDWLIIDMHEELKSWGYPGGAWGKARDACLVDPLRQRVDQQRCMMYGA